jgi:glycosyltransferase involved in cell wall biosynthesis
MTVMPFKNQLRFSVVIPCYNEEAYIEATLQSLKDQDYTGDYEVIVVDNNCTDTTTQIASKYNVRVVKESTAGVCWARQAGFAAAQGEIVVSSDADTTFDTDWLTKIDQEYKANPGSIAVCGPCLFVDAPWWGLLYCKLAFGISYNYYRLFGRPLYITATNTTFKREFFDGYDTTLTQGGDELGVLHKLKKRGKVVFTKNYVVHTSSRRLERGLLYNMFVVSFYYYTVAYNVNRLFGRTVIGSAPAYRPLKLTAQNVVNRARASAQRSHKSVKNKRDQLIARGKKSISKSDS